MKFKAPDGVGDPCIAGVPITSRGGLYEVEAEIGALLIEWFGFVQTDAKQTAKAAAPAAAKSASAPRRRAPAKKPPSET